MPRVCMHVVARLRVELMLLLWHEGFLEHRLSLFLIREPLHGYVRHLEVGVRRERPGYTKLKHWCGRGSSLTSGS